MRTTNNSGFTLIELLIVVAIFAVGSAIALPSLMDMGRRDQVKTEARQIKDQMARARAQAIELNTTINVSFTANSFTIGGANNTLSMSTINPIPANMSWDNRGYPSAATVITISGNGKTFNINVSLAGNISINQP